MNLFRVNALMTISRVFGFICIPSAVAILLLAPNIAFAAEQQAKASASTIARASLPPEAPVPSTADPVSLAEEMRQEQQQSPVPQKPFNVPIPHSRNPLSPY